MDDKVDCVIIGGCLGALTAALYVSRANKKVWIIPDHDIPNATEKVLYPGHIERISVEELLFHTRNQAEEFGAFYYNDAKVLSIKKENNHFTLLLKIEKEEVIVNALSLIISSNKVSAAKENGVFFLLDASLPVYHSTITLASDGCAVALDCLDYLDFAEQS